MKIMTQLLLSYLSIIVVTIAGTLILVYHTVDGLHRETTASARDSVDFLATANYQLSERILRTYGEQSLDAKVSEVAATLAFTLDHLDKLDYGALRKNDEVRRIATQSIHAWGRESGYVDLNDRTGLNILHPNKSVEGRNFSEWKDQFPDMWKLVERSGTEAKVRGYYTFLDTVNESREKYMVLMHVPGTNFVVVGAVNIDEYFLPVHRKIRSAQQSALRRSEEWIREAARSALSQARGTILAGSFALFAFGGGVALILGRSMARPFVRLRDAVTQIGEGNFTVDVDEKGTLEVRDLARSFNRLGGELTQYVQDYCEAVASTERIECELSAAARIQMSLVPHTFPPFPGHGEFEIHALLVPARAVGGDFYDFFFMDEDHLCLVIGDVSGKGVPAAILMAVVKSLIGSAAIRATLPDGILGRVNGQLLQGNDSSMFVSVFCAVLNIRTGRLVYVNAGHNSPVALRNGQEVEEFGRPGGPVLGLFEDAVFRTDVCTLKPGDVLITFTDGLTEACDRDGSFFGYEGLKRCIAPRADQGVKELVEGILEDVVSFTRGEPGLDDIAIMAVRFGKPFQGTHSRCRA
ncbi:MAG: SpoIIE family protein phosphatase [Desulfomonile tiedjei]|nr:SpoIIE family protein phosphatase [Desulfomonile tiedjei]